MQPHRLPLAVAMVAALVACQSTPVDVTPIAASSEKLRAVALDESYVSLVALTDPNLGPSTAETAFGPLIGRYFLTDDFAVHRHLKPVRGLATPQPSATDRILGSAAEPVEPAPFAPYEQLTYFLVNPDGIVTGIATGRLVGETDRCIMVEPGTELVQTCDDPARLDADLRRLDATVRTLDGLPVSSWATGTLAEPPAQ